MIAPDLAVVQGSVSRRRFEKKPGRRRLLFLSRISPKKNLDGP